MRMQAQAVTATYPGVISSRMFGSSRAGHGPAVGFASALIAFFIVVITDLVLMLSADRFQHWFLIPISVCGILTGIDAIDWIRGRLDLYDPVGILGLLGIHVFYLSSLLHIQWETFNIDLPPPPDWRDWLGYMGFLNAAGLVLYRVCRQFFKNKPNSRPLLWKIDKARFRAVVLVCVAICAVLQTGAYARFGGITGYMDAVVHDRNAWVGTGWIFMISESAPILIAFLGIVLMQQKGITWSRALLAMLALFCVQMYFGGLRGSRSQTIELFFWVIGCVHLLVRPVPRRFIYAGLGVLILFCYVYAFYKALGTNAMQAITASSEDRQYIARTQHKTFRTVVLGDMSRADLQAYVLYRLMNDAKDYFEYAKGRTYLGAVSIWIPRWLLPAENRPLGPVKEGTEIEYGSGFDINQPSSHVYGLAAEAMLNFGPLGAPLSYAAFGLLVGWLKRGVYGLPPGDARLLWVPFGVWMCLGILLGDSDNNTFGLVKDGLIPFLIVVVCSKKLRYQNPPSIAPEMAQGNSMELTRSPIDYRRFSEI